MAKRRLSKQQTRRIKHQQNASLEKVERAKQKNSEQQSPRQDPAENALSSGEKIDVAALGAEQRGRVVAHYGTQVEIEVNLSTEDHGQSSNHGANQSSNRSSNTETVSTPARQHQSIRCHLRANLDPIITGDCIIWQAYGDGGVVVSCEERKSLLSRPDPYGKLKPVAANLDQIVVVIAPEPEFFTNLIDRYLVVAEINSIRPLLLVNKSDLIDEDRRAQFERLKTLYTSLGYRVHELSAKTKTGLQTLQDLLDHKTSIFVGQSGVGKSSIIQSLLPKEDIEVGDLSQAKTKGRHTTTHSQLFHFAGGGECIDSPGIREFGLWNLNADELIRGFPEIAELAQRCKFRDCKHESEPQCAILQGLEEGVIASSRFENYQRILSGLNDVSVRTDCHKH